MPTFHVPHKNPQCNLNLGVAMTLGESIMIISPREVVSAKTSDRCSLCLTLFVGNSHSMDPATF